MVNYNKSPLKPKKSTVIDTNRYQELVNFIELRFGVYLDSVMGYQYNVVHFNRHQRKNVAATGLSPEELDTRHLIRSKDPPPPTLEECHRLEIHRMPQGDFKRNNTPGGLNYAFAIENCLSDIVNYWNAFKLTLGLENKDEPFPVLQYMRDLRNRTQHDLFNKRKPTKECISMGETITSYVFPTFQIGQLIQLFHEDIEAIVLELRAQLEAHRIA